MSMLPNICECMTPWYPMSLEQNLSETGGIQWAMRAQVPAAVQSLLPTARSAALSPQKQPAALANSGLRSCKFASTDSGACCQATGACNYSNFAPASGFAVREGFAVLPCLHEPKACLFDAPMRCVGLSNAAVEILMHLAFVSDGMRETPALFSSLKRQSDSIACLVMRCRREAGSRAEGLPTGTHSG